jgi:hypothetical protein
MDSMERRDCSGSVEVEAGTEGDEKGMAAVLIPERDRHS